MTTTPGAVRGILVAGARKCSTPRATAPQRTTTLLTDVRIHPAPVHLPFCLLFIPFLRVHEHRTKPLCLRYYFKPCCLLSLGFEARSVRVWMQVREGHGCCRRGGLLGWKDVKIAEQLSSCRRNLVVGQQQRQMWPVIVVGVPNRVRF